jgi:hypothetical protein
VDSRKEGKGGGEGSEEEIRWIGGSDRRKKGVVRSRVRGLEWEKE